MDCKRQFTIMQTKRLLCSVNWKTGLIYTRKYLYLSNFAAIHTYMSAFITYKSNISGPPKMEGYYVIPAEPVECPSVRQRFVSVH